MTDFELMFLTETFSISLERIIVRVPVTNYGRSLYLESWQILTLL